MGLLEVTGIEAFGEPAVDPGEEVVGLGSMVQITNEENGRIEGTFRTALEDSGFYGQDVPILGVHRGDCIGFSAAGGGEADEMVVSYTGLLRDGKMETLWFVVADTSLTARREGAPAERKKLNWWRSATINSDTFERSS
jgi:hypothetical protein